MNLIPRKHQGVARSPFQDILDLQSRVNQLFDFSMGGWDQERSGLLEGEWSPAVDVYDSKDNILVKADLPGLKKEDIDISINDGLLEIRGEKKSRQEQKGRDFVRTERFCGSFCRQIALPSSVDHTKAKAAYKDGVLELELPKKEEAKPKQIKVNIE